ncbi:hypothetical protein BRYFOR_08813 [Marvinbryantia formatexigens DSM 14469]|uniref:DNA alkylation repair enzyme n=1 Tax=Marvinbryantia formatexigens DSM 14469 TaxID=478749 RepID=C6LJH7_9FIRM|nr:DNA alkylation repair protein [Marvinbryantia formatexigens]EET59291.1 hypothetical protein BRYFOR_08813 [Marvinbryantia formatexigens DSM 14469]UWO25382.1 DNA alkylation repair protein [Marvinbryantia formatexigens DSM 14469]SDG73079.1 3-methyladenine DNA glycosylase AlkD [Marvinbryantia formatexigens]
MNTLEKRVQTALSDMQDPEYKAFQSKLIPTVNPDRIIGIRTPQLRKFAREFAKSGDAAAFMKLLPHTYYEEDNLHGFLIESMKDFQETIDALDTFLPYVDNWATCDLMVPKVLKKHPQELFEKIRQWLASGQTYTIRFGIGMLMRFYLDELFQSEYPTLVAAVRSEEYYVNMMVAWYFATALAKQYDAILPYFQQKMLEPWTHNKAIQKAIESSRITDEQKVYLRTLKIK